MHKTIGVIITIFICVRHSEQKYVIPDVIITPLSPKGLRVQLPDSAGVQAFGFHANINQPIKGKEYGTVAKRASGAENGYWTVEDPNIQLKTGDTIHYWLFVQHNRLGFDKQDQQYLVTDLVDSTSAGTASCGPSETRRNEGNTACAGELIFEESFNDDILDEGKWIREQYIPWEPDYEFCSYEKSLDHCFVNTGSLCLKASVRENLVTNLDLSNGCTGQNCTAQHLGVPVAVAGKITSRFSFRYGKVEIRAKLPTADWVYPQLYLLPKKYEYGPGYSSGRIWLAYARGNVNLKTDRNEDIGNNVLYVGPVLSVDEPGRTTLLKSKTGVPWGNDFHTYSITWKPDGISVAVDGNQEGTILPPNGAYSSLKNTAQIQYASAWTTNSAPFDKEFVISLGIGVGGYADFPDNVRNNGMPKPWNKRNSRGQYKWISKADEWKPTWTGDKNLLKVDYIKVWAL